MYASQSKFIPGLREEYANGHENRSNGTMQESLVARKKQFENIVSDYFQGGPSSAMDDKYLKAQESSRPDHRLSIGSTFSTKYHDLYGREALLGIKRPKPHKIWKKKFIKLMVVGDSGLGKTTLIKSLMSTPGERMQVHDGSYTPRDQFRKDPESLCSTVTWRDEEDRTIWVYKIQDTPGYGDDLNLMNSISMMQQFIEKQNHKWLELEQSKDRKEDLSEVEDPRVDLCLFCIPPHRIRPMDLLYMSEISQHVPVVPIVTKADTMTIREAGLYRQEVANKIANPMLPGIKEKINIFKFERDTLERAGVSDSSIALPPFLVVASNDINEDLSSGEPSVFWPERRYPWGTAEAFNPGHSDLMSLRALLLKEALEEVSKSKRSRYEDWRGKKLGGVKIGQRLWSIFLWTLVPAIITLQIGRSGMTAAELRRLMKQKIEKSPFRKLLKIGSKAPEPTVPDVEPVPQTEEVITIVAAPEPPKKKPFW